MSLMSNPFHRTAMLAAVAVSAICSGIVPAAAHYYTTRCDRDGDDCYTVRCDNDGDDCERVRQRSHYYGRAYGGGYGYPSYNFGLYYGGGNDGNYGSRGHEEEEEENE